MVVLLLESDPIVQDQDVDGLEPSSNLSSSSLQSTPSNLPKSSKASNPRNNHSSTTIDLFDRPNTSATPTTLVDHPPLPANDHPLNLKAKDIIIPTDQQDHPRSISTQRALAIISICVIAFIVNNATSLSSNLLIPSIQRELNIEASDLQWVSSGFPLGFGSCLLLFGRLADIYGHKLFIQLGTGFFGLSSLGCALSRNHVQISIFRVFQGLGAAATAPSLIGVLGSHLEPNSVLKRIGFASLSAGAPLGGTFGLLVGGFITQGTRPGWRSFFYLCAACAMFVVSLVAVIVPADRKGKRKIENNGSNASGVDWLGAILIISGLVLLTFSLGVSSREGWNRVIVLLPFILSIIILTGFVLWQKVLESPNTINPLTTTTTIATNPSIDQVAGRPNRRLLDRLQPKQPIQPILKLDLFRRYHHQFSVVLMVVCLLWFGFVIQNFFFHQYLQDYLRLDLTQSVIRFIPMLVLGLLLNISFGFFSHRIPAQLLMIIGCLGTAASCILSAMMDTTASYWHYNFASVALSVVGPDFVFATGTMYGSQISSQSEQAVTGGLFHTFAQMGNAIGLSLATLLQVEVTRSKSRELGVIVDNDLTIAPPEAFLEGLRAGFWLCFGSLCFATLLCIFFLRHIGFLGRSKPKIDQDPSSALEKS